MEDDCVEGDIMTKIRVLFLCTGNSARSQMAEAFLRKYGGERFEAFSAGTEPQGIHPLTQKVMAEIGIDLKDSRSKSFKDYFGKTYFAYLVIVCSAADKQCPAIFPGVGARLVWPFEDPAKKDGTEEEKLGAFREVRDQISDRLKVWVDILNLSIT